MTESAAGVEPVEPIAPTTTPAPAAIAPAVPALDVTERLMARLEAIEERARQAAVTIPGSPTAQRALLDRGRWASIALRAISGERVPELELRAVADVTTADNLGVVPDNIRSEIIGIIDPARPFLQSTRQVPAGDAGLTQVFPKIDQRPITGVQTAEKTELPSQKTIISTVQFDAITVGGVGDLSMQLLKRSSPSFLALWLDLLAEAYAIDADDLAVDALLAAAGVNAGGTFDPSSPIFGAAFTNAAAVARTLKPDRIWLSTAALAAFMDAKTPTGGGGAPMYPMVGLGGLTASGDSLGVNLTPVHVPALDDEAVDLVIGPSRGFAWSEDGTYTLQADVPSKFGRDVGLAGMLWFMPVYPAAFTTYTLPAVGP